MTRRIYLYLVVFIFAIIQFSCLSFKGITIPENVNTFNVPDFVDRSNGPIPNLDIDFSTKMRDKVRQNSRLSYDKNNPDIVIEGEISRATVQSVAPSANNEADYNKLVIKVKVNYYSNKDPEVGFNKTFEHFGQFPTNDLLSDHQDLLVEEIFEQITEQVFNEAFTNW